MMRRTHYHRWRKRSAWWGSLSHFIRALFLVLLLDHWLPSSRVVAARSELTAITSNEHPIDDASSGLVRRDGSGQKDALRPVRDNAAMLLISTTDGTVYGVEAITGRQRWSFHSGSPLFSSSGVPPPPKRDREGEGDKAESTNTDDLDEVPLFIPGPNGHLYAYVTETGELKKIPVHEMVANSPFIAEDGTIIMGSKKSHMFALDPLSGAVRTVFSSTDMAVASLQGGQASSSADPKRSGSSSASPEDEDEDTATEDGSGTSSSQTFYFGRSDYMLKAIDGTNGTERWTVNIGEFVSAKPANTAQLQESPVILITTANPHILHVFETRTGAHLWSLVPSSPVMAIYRIAYADEASRDSPFLVLETPFLYPHARLPSSGDKGKDDSQYWKAMLEGKQAVAYIVEHEGQLMAYPLPAEHSMMNEVIDYVQFFDPITGLLPSVEEVERRAIEEARRKREDKEITARLLAATEHQHEQLHLDKEDSALAIVSSARPTANKNGTTHLHNQILAIRDDEHTNPVPEELPQLEPPSLMSWWDMFAIMVDNPDHALGIGMAVAITVGTAVSAVLFCGLMLFFAYRRFYKYPAKTNTVQEPITMEPLPVIEPPPVVEEKPAPEVVETKKEEALEPLSKNQRKRLAYKQPNAKPKSKPKTVKTKLRSVQEADGSVRVGKLLVSPEVLGYGSSGTIVYKGALDGRVVAVKRMLSEFFEVANKEISTLLVADEHPHVISYYSKEDDGQFIYLALSYCVATLADLVETERRGSKARKPELNAAAGQLSNDNGRKRMLLQLIRGMEHLHSLGIVHRDMKPHNVLIDKSNVLKISDMGLAKKLDTNQSSFTASGGGSQGTLGWQALELLLARDQKEKEQRDDIEDDEVDDTKEKENVPVPHMRITKKVDIFALGCMICYVLTRGRHPFGESFEREVNIRHNKRCIPPGLAPEAVDVILAATHIDPIKRPDAWELEMHPVFWTEHKKLLFLKDASDRLENEKAKAPLVVRFEEECAPAILRGMDWTQHLDPSLIHDLGKYRNYSGTAARDLLRVIRNKSHHYRDLPTPVRRMLGTHPEGFLTYFLARFPHLLIITWGFIRSECGHELAFRRYFERSADSLLSDVK